jgi:dihydrofolate synthase/folylpolyglutamate synthase
VILPRRGEPRAWLDAHVNLETGVGTPRTRERGAPTLERIGTLLQYLGSPQLEYPAIHLTGTNGKTTTTRIVTQLLASAGYIAGAYTSPHLQRVNERIVRNDEPITDDELDEQLRVVALVEHEIGVDPSYFEVLTGAGLRWFADVAVDVAVLEVGLGGTWDATNVVDGDVAVVTNVSIDHTQYLGTTVAQIASEKAGIVKEKSILVLGESDPDLAELFTDRHPARVLRRDADFGVVGSATAVGGRVVDLYTQHARYTDVFVPLHGAHQADNAAIALAAAEAFAGGPLDDDAVREGFAAASSPGRLEVVGRHPLVLLDGAHNVAGAHALRAALADEFVPAPRTLVVGMLRERDAAEMLAAFGLDEVELLVCAPPPNPRALAPAEIAEAARRLGFPAERIEVVDAVAEAVSTALLATPTEGEIIITGSLYFVGAARGLLVKE